MKSTSSEIEKKRSKNIQEVSSTHFDALIIGGGINGAAKRVICDVWRPGTPGGILHNSKHHLYPLQRGCR